MNSFKSNTSRFKPGDRVVYRDSFTREPEEGTVTSINDKNVFVCYGLPGSTSQATSPEDLEHMSGSIGDLRRINDLIDQEKDEVKKNELGM